MLLSFQTAGENLFSPVSGMLTLGLSCMALLYWRVLTPDSLRTVLLCWGMFLLVFTSFFLGSLLAECVELCGRPFQHWWSGRVIPALAFCTPMLPSPVSIRRATLVSLLTLWLDFKPYLLNFVYHSVWTWCSFQTASRDYSRGFRFPRLVLYVSIIKLQSIDHSHPQLTRVSCLWSQCRPGRLRSQSPPVSVSQVLGLQCAPQLSQHLLIKLKVPGNRGVSRITHTVGTVGDPDPPVSE